MLSAHNTLIDNITIPEPFTSLDEWFRNNGIAPSGVAPSGGRRKTKQTKRRRSEKSRKSRKSNKK